jgi:hypothetical protein
MPHLVARPALHRAHRLDGADRGASKRQPEAMKALRALSPQKQAKTAAAQHTVALIRPSRLSRPSPESTSMSRCAGACQTVSLRCVLIRGALEAPTSRSTTVEASTTNSLIHQPSSWRAESSAASTSSGVRSVPTGARSSKRSSQNDIVLALSSDSTAARAAAEMFTPGSRACSASSSGR